MDLINALGLGMGLGPDDMGGGALITPPYLPVLLSSSLLPLPVNFSLSHGHNAPLPLCAPHHY